MSRMSNKRPGPPSASPSPRAACRNRLSSMTTLDLGRSEFNERLSRSFSTASENFGSSFRQQRPCPSSLHMYDLPLGNEFSEVSRGCPAPCVQGSNRLDDFFQPDADHYGNVPSLDAITSAPFLPEISSFADIFSDTTSNSSDSETCASKSSFNGTRVGSQSRRLSPPNNVERSPLETLDQTLSAFTKDVSKSHCSLHQHSC